MIKKAYTPGLLKLHILNKTVYMPKYKSFKVRVNEDLNLTSACVIIMFNNNKLIIIIIQYKMYLFLQVS